MANGFGNTKVDDFRNGLVVFRRDENIRWLDIAVDNALLMSMMNCETDLLKKADTIAVVDSNDKEVELLVISESHLAEIREKFSNRTVEGWSSKTKKVISWSHNRKEVEEGLARREEYFQDLVKRAKVLVDKKASLAEFRK